MIRKPCFSIHKRNKAFFWTRQNYSNQWENMSLTDLWEKSKAEYETKNVQQIISIAGDGNLKDASVTSEEFRSFLKGIPTDLIQKYADPKHRRLWLLARSLIPTRFLPVVHGRSSVLVQDLRV